MAISIRVSDSRNNTTTKTIPFIRYTQPEIQIIKVENGVVDDDTIIIMPPKTIVTLRAYSPIGLKEIRYRVADTPEQVITVNNNKEYVFNLEITY